MKKIFACFILCVIAFSSNAWGQDSIDPSKFIKDPTIQVPDSLRVENLAKTLENLPVKTTESTSSGSTTSGNVEESSYTGISSLSGNGDDYGMGTDCGKGNIFQQLGCRAAVIGGGLRTVGYMIAGFGLIVFAFAAIFGKVKWPVFATIAFSCFLLSMTMYVVNTMTKEGDASWIGGVNAGSISTSSTDQPKGNTDANEVSKDKS